IERAGGDLDASAAAEVNGSGRQCARAHHHERANAVDQSAKLVGRPDRNSYAQAGRITGGGCSREIDQSTACERLDAGGYIVVDDEARLGTDLKAETGKIDAGAQ